MCVSMDVMRGLLLLGVINGVLQFTEASTSFVGCYRENGGPRHYAMSPGNYDTSTVTIEKCQNLCGKWKQNYAAMTGGRFCFCSGTLSDINNKQPDSECNSQCPDGNIGQCGTVYNVAVFRTSAEIRGLKTEPENPSTGIVEIGKPITFSYSTDQGSDAVVYSFNFGDGAGSTKQNETNMEKKMFSMPDLHVVSVTAEDQYGTTASKTYSVKVLSQAPAKNLTIECPEAVATYEDFKCNASVVSGSRMTVTVSWGDSTTDNFTVADSVFHAAGPAIPNVNIPSMDSVSVTNNYYIMPSAEFNQDGILNRFEYYTTSGSTGTLEIMILSPNCLTGQYCHRTKSCESSCTKYGSVGPCASPNYFCSAKGFCSNNCNLPARYVSNKPQYQVKRTFTISSPPANSYDFYPIIDSEHVSVSAGDILGYRGTGDIGISTIPLAVGTLHDVNMTTTPGPNYDLTSGSVVSRTHLLRAVASKPSGMKLFHGYNQIGDYTIHANICTELISSCAENTFLIHVERGINVSIIESEPCGQTGVPFTFSLAPHTGDNVTYFWDFGDGNIENTTMISIMHTFITRGVYNVSVRAANLISSKENMTTICIEDCVNNVTVVNTPAKVKHNHSLAFIATSGSDFTCVWTMGDSITGYSTDITVPITGGEYFHEYQSPGIYTVIVNCSNNVCSDEVTFSQIAQDDILGLTVAKKGAIVGEAIKIDFSITQGTNVSYKIWFDGNSVSYTDITPLSGSSDMSAEANTGIHNLTIVASNLVSQEVLEVNFTIEQMIIKPIAFSDKCNVNGGKVCQIMKGDCINFTAGAESGTSIEIHWNFPGEPMRSYITPLGNAWQTHHNMSEGYCFSAAGTFTVEITVKNNFNISKFSFEVDVYNKVENLIFTSNGAVEYVNSQGTVNFWFTTSGEEPTKASIAFDWGDGSAIENRPFSLYPATYSHTYHSAMSFTVKTNVSNLISWDDYQTIATMVLPVKNLEIIMNPPHVPVGTAVDASLIVEEGTNITFTIDWNDGSPVASLPRTGTTPWEKDTETHNYATTGQYNITVTATNILGTTTKYYIIFVQNVVPSGIQLSATQPSYYDPGTPIDVNFTLSYPAGVTLPDDATMTIDYGDGSPPKVEPFPFSGPGPYSDYQNSIQYNKPGVHTIKITISNKASSKTFTVQVGAFMKIEYLDGTPLWRPYLGALEHGLTATKNYFPLTEDVYFDMTFNGTVTEWRIMTMESSGAAIQLCNYTSSPPLAVQFDMPGHYEVAVTAFNVLDPLIKNFDVYLFQPPVNFEIKDNGLSVRPNVSKSYEFSFSDFGRNTCLVIDWGDNNRELYANETECETTHNLPIVGALELQLQINHTYESVGKFPISGQASILNVPYYKEANAVAWITQFDCNPPKLTFQNIKATDFKKPQTYSRSEPFQVSVDTELDCSFTLQNKKQWTVEKMNKNNFQVEQILDLSLLPEKSYSQNNPELAITARYLEFGIYRFTFNVKMVSDQFGPDEEFSASVETYIEVTEAPLIAALGPSGQSFITIGVDDITLNASKYSRDPNVDPGIVQGFDKFRWECNVEHEQLPSGVTQLPLDKAAEQRLSNNGGCFKQGNGLINTTDGSLSFTTNFMSVGVTYEFNLTVYKGSSFASTIFSVKKVQGVPPTMEILCSNKGTCQAKSDGLHVNPSSKAKLIAGCGDTPCDANMVYQWSIYREGLEGSKIEVQNLNEYIIGVNSYEIEIKTSLFNQRYGSDSQLYTYFVKLTGYISTRSKAASSSSVAGTALTIMLLNEPPKGGNCSINSTSGVELDDYFYISCPGWYDVDTITNYKFYAQFEGIDIPRELGFTYADHITVQLPVGPSNSNYTMDIIVKIFDKNNAFTQVNVSKVQILPKSTAVLQAYLDQLLADNQNEVYKAALEGNLVKSSKIFYSVASVLNSLALSDEKGYLDVSIASHDLVNGYGKAYDYLYANVQNNYNNYSANGSSAVEDQLKQQYAVERNKRSELRQQMADSIANMTYGNIADCQLASSTLATVVQRTEEVNLNTQQTSTKALEKMKGVLENLASNTPIEEVEKSVVLVLTVASSVLEAARFSQIDPTIGDEEKAKQTYFYEYDTSWESNKPGYQGKALTDARENMVGDSASDRQTHAMVTMTPNIMNTVVSVVKLVVDGIVVGAPPVELTTPKLQTTVVKNTAASVTNQTYIQGNGSFEVPSWNNLFPNAEPDDTISLAMIATVVNMIGSVPNQLDVPYSSGTMTIDAFDRIGSPISVSNTMQPVIITIPQTSNTTAPVPFTYHSIMSKNPTTHLFYHSFNVTSEQASLHLKIQPEDPNVQFLVLIRFEKYPHLNRTDLNKAEWDFLALVPHNMSQQTSGNGTDEDAYTIFLNNIQMRGYVGRVIVGLRQLDQNEWNLYSETNFPPIPEPYTGRFTTDYKISVFTSGCFFMPSDEFNGPWQTSGCKVLATTTYKKTVCECNHLTTFAGGFAVQPNAIDFDYVFANADFFKNMTLYITEILVAFVYICFAIWARRQDNKDIEKLGVTPLPDNEPKDKYLYEIQISTGSRKNAATDSKVHFILSGEYDETDVRMIDDTERKIFRRGSTDNFLMATPRPLGPIQYARIWHDNSGRGKFQGWYVRFVIVHDLQTKEKFFFIINEWFAVEEGDGQIDRLYPVAGPENMVEFNVLFSQKTRKKLSDEHIWFSVVARPPKSRFTRLQRVSCCLCLLFTSMMANAMYYQQVAAGPSSNGVSIGPFSLSPEQIYVGIICNLVVFPINFLIVTLFRKAPPRKKRPSRIQDALDKANYQGSVTSRSKSVESDKVKLVDHAAESQFSAIDSRASTPKLSPAQPLQPAHQLNMTTLNMDTFAKSQQKKEKVVKKKKCFNWPWWFRIVAWILLLLTVAVSVAIVTFYGIQFGDDKCRKWITSMVISFVTSIFLTQPIKVFLVAMLFSLFFKKVDMEEEGDEDEEEIKLQPDETWLHQYPDPEGYMPVRERKIAYNPPDPEKLQEAREYRLKELKMYDIMREIIFYSIYVWILLVVSYGFRDPFAFIMKKSVSSTILDAGLGKLDVSSSDNDFRKVLTYDNFFNWMNETMAPGLRAGKWYNGMNPFYQRGMIGDRNGRMMGFATLRQLRIKNEKCITKIKELRHIIPNCTVGYSILNEETRPYGVGWKPLEVNGTWNNSKYEYVFRSGASLDSYPYWGKHAVYSGGGYIVRLRGSLRDLRERIAELRRDEWVDSQTRAIFIEFTVYNANVNLFGITTLLAEFMITGGIQTSYRVEPMNLLGYISRANIFQLVCEIIFLLFIVFFIVKEARKLYKERRSYFGQFWNWVEVCIIVLSITCTTIYFYRWFYAKQLTEIFKVSGGNAYMKFQYAGYWNETLMYFLGMLCFLGSIKFIRLLRFNKRMGMLASTLRYGAKSLFLFMIMFLIMFLAFAQFFFLIYSMSVDNFRTIITAIETLLQMLVGKFNFNAMVAADPIMGPLVFFFYVVTVYYILINMFLTILNESFATVRNDISQQANDHEMVEFIMDRFKTWTGLNSLFGIDDKQTGSKKDIKPKIEKQLQVFPEKVDRLLDILCKAYINSDYFDAMFDSSSVEGKAAMKNLIKASKENKGKIPDDDQLEGACAYPKIRTVEPWQK